MRNISLGRFPYPFQVHFAVVVGDDIAHATNLPEGNAWKLLLHLRRDSSSSLADYFQAPEDGILLFTVGVEGLATDSIQVGNDGSSGVPHVDKETCLKLIAHTKAPCGPEWIPDE